MLRLISDASAYPPDDEIVKRMYYHDPIKFATSLSELEWTRSDAFEFMKSFPFKTFVDGFDHKDLLVYWEDIRDTFIIIPLATICKIRNFMKYEDDEDNISVVKHYLDILDKMKPVMKLDIERQEHDKLYTELLNKYYSMKTGII